jgi:hypothetical protein
MNIKYGYHEEKRLCCGKTNQNIAYINYSARGLSFRASGCADNKLDAKKNLLLYIKKLPKWMQDAITL